MIRAFVRLQLFLARRRAWVLAALAALVVGGTLVLGPRLRLREDFTDMLPLADPAINEQYEAMQLFPQANRLYIDVGTGLDSSLGQLGSAADALYTVVIGLEGVREVRYRVDDLELQQAFHELQNRLPTLLAGPDLAELESRLEEPALAKRLAWFKQTLAKPQGWASKELLRSDPIGLSDAVTARLQGLRAGFGARLVNGRSTSADGRHVILSVTPDFPPADRPRSEALLRRIYDAAQDVERRFHEGRITVTVAGAHRVAVDNATLIRRDATLTTGIATIAILILTVAVFRRWWLVLLCPMPTAVGMWTALAALGLRGDPISVIALGCGGIFVGIAVDYATHVLYHHADSPPGSRGQLAEMVAQLAPPITFGALTTAAAFLVLTLSLVPGHRQLGLFSAIGIVASACLSVVLLPAFLPAAPALQPSPLWLTSCMGRALEWRARHRRALRWALLAWSLVCLIGLDRLRVDGDVNRLNGVTPATRDAEAAIQRIWGQTMAPAVVVVSAPSREMALRQNEAVHTILDRLHANQAVVSFSSVAPFFPSARERDRRGLAWQQFWTSERLQNLNRTITAAAAGLGFREGAFSPALEALATSVRTNAPGSADSPVLEGWLGEYISGTDGRTVIASMARLRDLGAYERLRSEIRQVAPDARLLDKAALASRLSRLTRQGLLTFAVVVVCANALLLGLLLGRFALVLVTLLPVLAGLGWTFGTLGLLGVPLNVASSIFVIFVVGVGVDYSLFLVTAKLAFIRGLPERLAVSGGSVAFCAATTLIGIGALVFAQHPALFSVGLTALLGMSLGMVATFALVPGCMDWLLTRLSIQVQADRLMPPPPRPAPAHSNMDPADASRRRQQVARLYRYQGPSVENFVYWKLRMDPLFRAIDTVVPQGGVILDLGCGYGLAAHWLTQRARGRTVLGLDFDERKIRVAQASAQHNSQVAFRIENLVALEEYPPSDCALLLDLLHYLPRPQKALLLARTQRSLRPGGLLVLRDACKDASPRHRWVACSEVIGVFLGQNRTLEGLHFETLDAYRSLLEEAGFARIQVYEGTGLGSNLLITAAKS